MAHEHLHLSAAVRLQRVEAERREPLLRLHAAGISLSTLTRMSGRSVQSVSRVLRGHWRA